MPAPMSHRMAERLRLLAVALCQDAGVGLEVAEGRWAYDPWRRVFLVSEEDLLSRGAEYCAGIMAHEISHFFISRYHLFSIPFPSHVALGHLLNSLEDPRVDSWIRLRYPGTRRWQALNAATEDPVALGDGLPDFLQFCLFACTEHNRAWAEPPGGYPGSSRLVRALRETLAARRAYAFALPPEDMGVERYGAELLSRYREEVVPILKGGHGLSAMPDSREKGIRLSAWSAVSLARREIFPAAEKLLSEDIEAVARFLEGSCSRMSIAQRTLERGTPQDLAGLIGAAIAEGTGEETSSGGQARAIAERMMDALLDANRRKRIEGAEGQVTSLPRGARLQPPDAGEFGKEPRLRQDVSPQHPYDEILARVCDQVNVLSDEIDKVLLPKRRMRKAAGFPSGSTVDMRKLMAFEADPRRYGDLWTRKTLPDRTSTVFSLLVDLSGSMRDEKIQAAVAGTVLMAETLHRLGVRFAINGFQDELIPFCNFGEGITTAIRERIAEMPKEVSGTRSGGNNRPRYNDDGPSLLNAAERLLAEPAESHVLIAVSDGVPEGCRSTPDDLRQAIERLSQEETLVLIGIGLGPDTEHVEDYYPYSIGNVPLGEFAERIGKTIKDVLFGRRGRATSPSIAIDAFGGTVI